MVSNRHCSVTCCRRSCCSSGVVLAAVGLEAAPRRRVPSEIALVLTRSRIGAVLVMAGTLAVLSFGLWLEQRGYSFTDARILGAIGLLITASVLGAMGGQRPNEARLLATRLTTEDDHPNQQLTDLLRDRTSLLLNYMSAVAIVGILALMALMALMVWKP